MSEFRTAEFTGNVWRNQNVMGKITKLTIVSPFTKYSVFLQKKSCNLAAKCGIFEHAVLTVIHIPFWLKDLLNFSVVYWPYVWPIHTTNHCSILSILISYWLFLSEQLFTSYPIYRDHIHCRRVWVSLTAAGWSPLKQFIILNDNDYLLFSSCGVLYSSNYQIE